MKNNVIQEYKIIYNSTEILVNPIRLAIFSPYFKQLPEFLENIPLIINDSVPTPVFILFLDAAQGKEVTLSAENAYDFLKLSKIWKINSLFQKVSLFIEKNPDIQKLINTFTNSSNVSQIDSNNSEIQDNNNFIQLTPEIEKIIASHMDAAISIPSFLFYPISSLCQIFSNSEFICRNQHSLMEFVIKLLDIYGSKASPLAARIDLRLLPFDDVQKLLLNPNLEKSSISEQTANATLSLLETNELLMNKIETLTLRLEKLEQLNISSFEERLSKLENYSSSNTAVTNPEEPQKISELIEARIIEAETKAHKDLRKTNSTVNSLTKKSTTFETNLQILTKKEENLQKNVNVLSQRLENIEFSIKKHENSTIEEQHHFEGQPLRGILSSLSAKAHGNVHTTHTVMITASSSDHNFPYQVTDMGWQDVWFTLNKPQQWIQFDFLGSSVKIENYTIKTHKYASGQCHLKSWILEGSNDREQWEEIDHRQTAVLNGPNKLQTFPANSIRQYKIIRLRETGNNFRGDNVLALTNIEFFGILFVPQ